MARRIEKREQAHDPTGTQAIRKKFRKAARLRLNLVKAQLRAASMHDLLGLTPDGALSPHPPAARLAAFGHWLGLTMEQHLGGKWTHPYVTAAWEKGLGDAQFEVNKAGLINPPSVEHQLDLTTAELKGIAAAVTQQVTRVAAYAQIRRKDQALANALMNAVFGKIAEPRMTALTNTSVVGAYNHAKVEVYRASGIKRFGITPEKFPKKHTHDKEPEEDVDVGILTAEDVCEECQDYADGAPYELGELELPLHPNCRCLLPGTIVEGDVIAASKSFYSGPTVVLETVLGNRLTLTVNHPVLTAQRVLAAGELRKGVQLVYQDRNVGSAAADDKNNSPARIEDVFGALAALGIVHAPASAVDFHGDGEFVDGDVDMVFTDRRLLRGVKAGLCKSGSDLVFEAADAASGSKRSSGLMRALLRRHAAPFDTLLIGRRPGFDVVGFENALNSPAANCQPFGDRQNAVPLSVGSDDLASIFVVAEMTNTSEASASMHSLAGLETQSALPEPHALGECSDGDAALREKALDPFVVSPVLARQFGAVHASKIVLDEIVNVHRSWFRGHVYDLQTTSGYIIADGFLVKNCAYFPWDDLRFKGDAHISSTYDAEWDEGQHPRGSGGRFAFSGGQGLAGQTRAGRTGGRSLGREHVSRSFSRGSDYPGTRGRDVVGTWQLAGVHLQELSPRGAERFHGAIAAAKQSNRFGAAVTLYSQEDYEHARLFVAPDNSYGVALKGNDIVSLFKHENSTEPKVAAKALRLATQLGGQRLDCFDTMLPRIYSQSAFVVVARLPFDDQYKPDGWSYDTYKAYNNGRPDVVFMVHDPQHAHAYQAGEGRYVKSYEEGLAAQKAALQHVRYADADVDFIQDPITGKLAGSHPGSHPGIGSPTLHPSVVEVGGDEWNRAIAAKLETQYQKARPALEDLTTHAVERSNEKAAPTPIASEWKVVPHPEGQGFAIKNVLGEFGKTPDGSGIAKFETEAEAGNAADDLYAETVEEEEEEPEGEPPYEPESWEMLSGSGQSNVEEQYCNDSQWLKSEEESWYDNGGALDSSKYDVNFKFNEKVGYKDWAKDAIEEFKEENRVPYTTEQLLDALQVYWESNHGDGSDDPDIAWNDEKLQDPSDKPDAPDPSQLELPGMPKAEAPDYSKHLTEDMRSGLEKTLTKAFNDEAESEAYKMEPPDYLQEQAQEFAGQMWGELSDEDKFEWAKKNTNVIEDESTPGTGSYADKPPEPDVDKYAVAALPKVYDPLNLKPTTSSPNTNNENYNERKENEHQYRLTQKLAHYLSVERTKQIFAERNAITLGPTVQADPDKYIRHMDSALWESWKGSSTSPNGRLLQFATASELGGRLNLKTLREWSAQDAINYANKNYSHLGGWAGVRAYIRAKWEVTQYLLDKAGVNELNLYRGIDLEHGDPEKYKAAREGQHQIKILAANFTKLPTAVIDRNGAASTSLNEMVSNGWDGANRVVLRASVPRTAALSIPAYGQNIYGEREVVVAGTAWKAWDAWHGRAPSFNLVPMGADGSGIGNNAPELKQAA